MIRSILTLERHFGHFGTTGVNRFYTDAIHALVLFSAKEAKRPESIKANINEV